MEDVEGLIDSLNHILAVVDGIAEEIDLEHSASYGYSGLPLWLIGRS